MSIRGSLGFYNQNITDSLAGVSTVQKKTEKDWRRGLQQPAAATAAVARARGE